MSNLFWDGWGFTYAQGNVVASTLPAMTAEMQDFYNNRAIRKLRWNLLDYTFTNLFTDHRNAMLAGKAAGLDIGSGLSSNPTTLTNSNKGTFLNAQVAWAQWLEANGFTTMYIYNEESHHHDGSMTDDDVKVWAAGTLFPAIDAVFSGRIILSEVQTEEQYWYDNAPPAGMDLGFNFYGISGSFASFKSQLAAAKAARPNSIITEFGPHHDAAAVAAMSDRYFTWDMIKRCNAIREAGFTEAYPFSFDASSFKFNNKTFWERSFSNMILYWNITGGQIATARTYGSQTSNFPHKRVHDNGVRIQAEYTQADIDFLKAQAWATYHGDWIGEV